MYTIVKRPGKKKLVIRRTLSENEQVASGLLKKLIGTTGQEVITIQTEVVFTPEAEKTLYRTATILSAGAIISLLIYKL